MVNKILKGLSANSGNILCQRIECMVQMFCAYRGRGYFVILKQKLLETLAVKQETSLLFTITYYVPKVLNAFPEKRES
jgi:hypothetical protein